jgi:hypothetical protein
LGNYLLESPIGKDDDGSQTREIASIDFGRERKGVLVSLRVYLDGAGKEGSHPVITVGGFYAEASVCEDIERDWEAATGGKLFHLKNFSTPKCELDSIGWTQPERTDFLKRLAAIVNRPGCVITSVSLEVEDFNKTLGNLKFPQEIGPAYSACAYAVVGFMESRFMSEGTQRQKVHYIFEKGDREHEIIKVFGDWSKKNSVLSGLRGHSFEPKQTTTLLQPADLVAGIVQRCMVRAYAAFPNLDNGLARTRLNTFERHYSWDGVTSAVVSGHDTNSCYVANAKNFKFLDGVSRDFFTRHPEQLKERSKRLTFKPKSKIGKAK